MPEFNQSLLDFLNLFDSRLILMLLYDSTNFVINAFGSGAVMGAWFRRKKVESAPAVGLCCMHNALSSVFPLSQCKHQIGEVGKQSIVWFLTFSVTLLPKTIVIGSDRVCQDYSKSKVGRFWDSVYVRVTLTPFEPNNATEKNVKTGVDWNCKMWQELIRRWDIANVNFYAVRPEATRIRWNNAK